VHGYADIWLYIAVLSIFLVLSFLDGWKGNKLLSSAVAFLFFVAYREFYYEHEYEKTAGYLTFFVFLIVLSWSGRRMALAIAEENARKRRVREEINKLERLYREFKNPRGYVSLDDYYAKKDEIARLRKKYPMALIKKERPQGSIVKSWKGEF